jgi:2-C-methyl-D-erythritol 2,4-cyclodiphosphate synthase
MSESNRIGIGYDIHRLIEGRKLILGGVEITFEKGLMGHSDADVLTHAICDALLGAAALGDIGTHFPDSDPQFAGASSLDLLGKVVALVGETGFLVTNIDSVILAERPKLAPYIQTMRERLAAVMNIGTSQISVKAKTGEGLESVGRGDAMVAHVVALLQRR